VEFEKGDPAIAKISDLTEAAGMGPIREDAGLTLKIISEFGSERIVRFALEYARKFGRRKVTAVAKDNIMKFTDGLFFAVARRVAEEYPDIEYQEVLVDNMTMQLVQKPELYDVLVLPNLYGDILSDLCAGLVGGLGIAPGANLGEEIAVFEPVHGSAPKYTGMNKVNPMAMMFSGVMMLRHIGEEEAGNRLEAAMASIIAEGKDVTYDMKPSPDDPTAVGTSEVADAIIARLRA
jgi:isocitrate dehydrogenase (NAD+)